MPALCPDEEDRQDAAPSWPAVDPDVDLSDPRQQPASRRGDRAVLAAVAVGGVLGAEARYAVGVLVPAVPASFPLPILLINTTGCLLLGIVMVVITERGTVHRLVRPFLAAGLLGGYTTFSAFAQGVQTLVRAGHPAVALAYLALTLIAGWSAVWAGMAAGRKVARRTARRAGGAR